MDNEKVIDVETLGARKDSLNGKMNLIKDIAVESAIAQIQDVRTFKWAAGVGLYQGLKYKGSLGQGMKAGLATIAVVTGCNIVSNLINKIDEIKNA